MPGAGYEAAVNADAAGHGFELEKVCLRELRMMKLFCIRCQKWIASRAHVCEVDYREAFSMYKDFSELAASRPGATIENFSPPDDAA